MTKEKKELRYKKATLEITIFLGMIYVIHLLDKYFKLGWLIGIIFPLVIVIVIYLVETYVK